jgi:hypothetical protein
MKRLFALSVAALVFAACSESTAPEVESDIATRFGKSTPEPPPLTAICDGGPTCADFDDAEGTTAASNFGLVETTISPSGAVFSKRYADESVIIPLGNPGAGTATVRFALYTIGAWEGEAKKKVPDTIKLEWQCGINGAKTRIMFASFGNRISSVTSYPFDVEAKGHTGGQYYNTGKDILGYKGRTDITDQFEMATDVADARYNILRTINHSCTASELRIILTGNGLGSVSSASWAVDNLDVTF